MKRILFCFILTVVVCSHVANAQGKKASQKTLYDICGDPTATCRTSGGFGEEDLPIKVSGELEWMGEYKSKAFYAVILQSRAVKEQTNPVDDECGGQFTSSERQNAQALFPNNRVFSTAFGCYHFEHSYTNVNAKFNFLAVYGGATEAAANAVRAKALKSYPGANIRNMQAILCNVCH